MGTVKLIDFKSDFFSELGKQIRNKLTVPGNAVGHWNILLSQHKISRDSY